MKIWTLLLLIPFVAFADPLATSKETVTKDANQELLTEGGGGTIIGGGGCEAAASIKTSLLRKALELIESGEAFDPTQSTYHLLLRTKIECVDSTEINFEASADVDLDQRQLSIWLPKTLSEVEATEKIWQYFLENYYE